MDFLSASVQTPIVFISFSCSDVKLSYFVRFLSLLFLLSAKFVNKAPLLYVSPPTAVYPDYRLPAYLRMEQLPFLPLFVSPLVGG